MTTKKVRRAVALVTGHYLNKHFYKIGVVEGPTYRVSYEDEEDPQHMPGGCLALESTRLRYHGAQFFEVSLQQCMIVY